MIEEIEKDFKLIVIINTYQNTLYNLINSLDIKSSDCLELINKKLYNIFKSVSNLIDLSKKDHFNKNVLDILLQLTHKIQESLIYQCHNVASFGPKIRKV